MIASLLVLMLLLSVAQPQSLGVKSGDWAVYQKRFHQEQMYNDNIGININRNYLWIIELQVLSVDNTHLTYKQTDRLENGSVRLQATYTVDPTKPIYPTYNTSGILESELNMMLVPSGLGVGDHLPQVIWLPDAVGDSFHTSESQWVNSTTTEGDSLNPRTVNHVEWSRDIHYVKDSFVMDFHEDSQLSFDQMTGLMLHAVIRQVAGSHSDFGQVYWRNYIYDYRLIDSSVEPHNYVAAGFTVALLLVAVILVTYPRRR
jgi:hypothetical protein